VRSIEIILIAVGAFYVFAGFVLTRATLVSRLIDRAIAGITLAPVPRHERVKMYWSLMMASLVLASGATAMARLSIASWLFIAALLAQAAYLFLIAPRYIDPNDAPSASGRQQTTNAMVIYAAATAFVVWCDARGYLANMADAGWPAAVLAGGTILGHGAYLAWNVLRPPRKHDSGPEDHADA
jgi:hypothetical protein